MQRTQGTPGVLESSKGEKEQGEGRSVTAARYQSKHV